MRVLVTGANGFLGHHVCAALKKKGHIVIPLKRRGEKPEPFDLTRGDSAHRAILDSKANAVIHLAAKCGGIGANMINSATYWHDNILMGAHVLNACAERRVRKLVMVGSTCAYPKFPPSVPFQECDMWAGYPEETNAPYGIAKRALLTGAEAYRKQYGLNVVTVIPTNLYGPHDHFELETSHVIPALIRKMHEAKINFEKAVKIWGTGKATRDFLYAGDAAEAIVTALDKYNGVGPLNLGSGEEVSISKLVDKVANVVDYRGFIDWEAGRPDGQPRRILSTNEAKKHLGWRSQTGLLAGLKKTYEWFLKNTMAEVA